MDTLIDYITNQPVPDIGAEANRQAVERFLVEEKGFAKSEIEVDAPIEVSIAGETYTSVVDLIVRSPDGIYLMAFRIVAGSLGSREREILAASRLYTDYQIPYAVISDGKTAIILDTLNGDKIGEGLDAIPSKKEVAKRMKKIELKVFPKERIERESIIFRSYDSMNVHRTKK